MIRKLTIKNFKRFKNETVIELDPITVLIGANNSGKSTVLQALSILQYCLDVTRRKKNGEVLFETRTVAPNEFGALPTTPTNLWPNGQPKGPIVIRAELDGGAEIGFEFKLSFNRFGITPIFKGDVSRALEGVRIGMVPIHTGLVAREEYLLAPARAERLRELQHGSVIRNLLWDLKDNDRVRWKRLLEILGRMYPQAGLDVVFDKEIQRYIETEYVDDVLTRNLDIIVSGTGFQQALQILSGILGQNNTVVLLDEPDAHLHARLQGEMVRVFQELAEKDGMQFVVATHSPHVTAAAPPGTLQAMIGGRAHRFAETLDQVDLLDSLGAFDRMEVLPLLRTKAAVFVENREDRNLLELFARKKWGLEAAQKVWAGLSFLYTYQEPIAAQVHILARQVRDLLSSNGLRILHGGQHARFLAIADRDYRTPETVKAARLELGSRARSLKLDLRCVIWERNEIENYLMDPRAIEKAVFARLDDPQQRAAAKAAVRETLASALEEQKPGVQIRIAERLQADDSEYRGGGGYGKATNAAKAVVEREWGIGAGLCDAKRVLSQVRAELQKRGIRARLNEEDIVGAMAEVPEDIAKVLVTLQKHAGVRMRKRRRAAGAASGGGPAAARQPAAPEEPK